MVVMALSEQNCVHCGSSQPSTATTCQLCGASLITDVVLAANTQVGAFMLEGVLGRGGFGITYKARDLMFDVVVALKELFPDGLVTRAASGAVQVSALAQADFERVKKQFTLEANTLQKIKHHSSTRFIGLFAINNTLYLAMEFVEGETLEARIERGALLSFQEAQAVLDDVLGVLEEAHHLGLLHRDIKPANIILKAGGASLIDFGSGLRFEKNRTIQVSQRLLTPEYAPLELYGQAVRLAPAADLYSLAATMYEAISGVRPASALDRVNGAVLESLAKYQPNIAAGFIKTIDAALELRVDARPQSVLEFRQRLGAKPSIPVTPVASAVPNPPKVSNPVPTPRVVWLFIILASGVLLALILLRNFF